ncbi:hypothetical protein HMN09_00817100 [Mycena chlorophos]|uniref:Uncharacterized protein n=1 Tax=Mycena chlorophos TaxID=658473 RepID=A0A8H6SVV9_MYCCL|nr:hypothetical protein HMN09_00817100 [Mycena chlorophos]
MGRNYDYENATAIHLPKHWDEAAGRVVTWLPWLSQSHPVDSLLGAYTFVAVRTPEISPVATEFPARHAHTRTSSMGALGTLQLRLHAGSALAFDNVAGSFSLPLESASGSFVSLRTRAAAATFDRASFDGPPRPTLRYFDLSTSYMGSVPPKGHALEVLDAVDDNGNNYVALMLEYAEKKSKATAYLGKKDVEGEYVGLTEDESRRLGIGISFEEVEKSHT